MEKLNIAPFHIGQKVEYITGINMPKGTIDVVADIRQVFCGCWFIRLNKHNPNGGRRLANPSATMCECGHCGKVYPTSKFETMHRFWVTTSFRPVQEQTFPLMTYEKVMEKEKELISAN